METQTWIRQRPSLSLEYRNPALTVERACIINLSEPDSVPLRTTVYYLQLSSSESMLMDGYGNKTHSWLNVDELCVQRKEWERRKIKAKTTPVQTPKANESTMCIAE